jgi:hypothetical protein
MLAGCRSLLKVLAVVEVRESAEEQEKRRGKGKRPMNRRNHARWRKRKRLLVGLSGCWRWGSCYGKEG